MRKVLSLLLGVLLIAAFAVTAAADESGENAGTVPGTTEELVLDGIMDDAYRNGLCLEGITLGEENPAIPPSNITSSTRPPTSGSLPTFRTKP